VLDSASFAVSERNRRFLEYVTEEALAGRSERLKAYTIATTVFGRPVDFDPQTDPIVRMEARRVRRSLERFYLMEGEGPTAVRIDIPRGGYAPEFGRRVGGGPPPATRRETAVPRVIVDTFLAEGHPSLHFNRGFSKQVAIELLRRRRTVVCESEMWRRVPESGHILAGGVAVFGDELRVTALLLDVSTWRVMWGWKFDRQVPPGMILSVRDEVAEALAAALDDFLSAMVVGYDPNQAAHEALPRAPSPFGGNG
jgi:adenylate cyclase